MTSTEVAKRSPGAIAAMNEVNAELTARMARIPEAPDDGGAAMFWQLINAKSWEDLNNPWSAQGLAKLVGKQIRIETIHKMVSDIAEGPGWYLVAICVDTKTGEEVTFTTSAVAVMIQLIIMYTNDWLPCICIPRVAEKSTKSGFYPQHLEIIAVAPRGARNSDEQVPA